MGTRGPRDRSSSSPSTSARDRSSQRGETRGPRDRHPPRPPSRHQWLLLLGPRDRSSSPPSSSPCRSFQRLLLPLIPADLALGFALLRRALASSASRPTA